MKSRLAILSMLVAGMLLSTTGAGLAVTSLSNHNASVAEYTSGQNGQPGGGGGKLGEGTSGGGPAATNPTPTNTNTGGTNTLQPAQQVESGAGSGSLPFTGYLAIPVLLGGVALLGTGVLLRRRTPSRQE